MGSELPFVASLNGVDVFRTPASEVAQILERDGHQADADEVDHGPAPSFPALGLRLWRSDHPGAPPQELARHFMTALVEPPST